MKKVQNKIEKEHSYGILFLIISILVAVLLISAVALLFGGSDNYSEKQYEETPRAGLSAAEARRKSIERRDNYKKEDLIYLGGVGASGDNGAMYFTVNIEDEMCLLYWDTLGFEECSVKPIGDSDLDINVRSLKTTYGEVIVENGEYQLECKTDKGNIIKSEIKACDL